MNNWAQGIGYISALLTTTSFLPQAVKTWRTRSTSDLSPLMFTLFCIGVIGWLIYGIILNNLPMILANAFTILLAGTIMYFILIGSKNCLVAHFAFYVSDIEKMKLFYCDHFSGLASNKYYNEEKKFTSYFISFPSGARLELMHAENLELNQVNHWHIAFSVGSKSKVDRLISSLQNKDVQVLSKPRYTGDGYYEGIIVDPEGNYIEITV
jgi:lactoylglutathione lyase